jgi:hypothetical protein
MKNREKKLDSTPADTDVELNTFVALVPELYRGVNRLMEESTGTLFSKKVGVALWALAVSTRHDEFGPYLTISDLLRTFESWFAVDEDGASSIVSKVKKDMFDLALITIEGGTDHVHLTKKGEALANRVIATARGAVRETISSLDKTERRFLLDLANRIIASGR